MTSDEQNATLTIAYTDGSCIGNPGPGGWAVHVEHPDGNVVEAGGGEIETTNNRMELRAAIEALHLTAAAASVTIVTDSQYVRRGVTEWLAGWQRKNWVTSLGAPVSNQDLWRTLAELDHRRVEWRWTRAHVGTPGNERCDAIARAFSSGIERLHAPAGGVAQAPPRPARKAAPGVSYLSLVDGIVARHTNWPDCERRVRGARGARFKKAHSPSEEHKIVAAWGLPEAALFGV